MQQPEVSASVQFSYQTIFQTETESSIEITWVYLHAGKGSDVMIGSFYRPPHSVDSVLDELLSSILSIKEKFSPAQIFLGGDLNCHGIARLGTWDFDGCICALNLLP